MGEKMASLAQPVKIRYRKPRRKGDKPEAILDVAASSANASLLVMQKGVLLEKINHIFGEQLVTDIRFVHTPANAPQKAEKQTKPLTEEEKSSLSRMLKDIEDDAIRERLEAMGKALIQDRKE